MSWPHDNLIESRIIKAISAKEIWEIGAGTGSWCMMMDHCNRPNKINFHMVENFEYTASNFKPDFFWPNTPKEFTDYVDQTQQDLNQEPINTKYYFVDEQEIHSKLTESIDLVRIDIDPVNPEATMKWILDNGSDNLVVIVDDTVEISRVMMMQEQIELGNLKLLWWGINSAAWCHPNINSTEIFEKIMESPVEHFKQLHVDNKKFMGRTNEFLVTWPDGNFYNTLR